MNKIFQESRNNYISQYLFEKEYISNEEVKEIESQGKSFLDLGYV